MATTSFASNWIVLKDGQGKPFYFNTVTQKTQWEPPSEQPSAHYNAPPSYETETKDGHLIHLTHNAQRWEDEWMEMHGEHGDPRDASGECANAVFGQLDDYDPNSDDEGFSVGRSDNEEEEGLHGEKRFLHLLQCCGADRPRKKKASLVVAASGKYLTIHDYIVAVHPWLLRLRDDTLAASGDIMDNKPLPADTKLVVWGGPAEVSILEDEEWRNMKAKRPPMKESKLGAASNSLPSITRRTEVLASTLEQYR
ncbi:hypothetical protein P154DRAFT_624479 [Amniculicola lignicola CBS 123094]|uniref:WW domain-containing protein n=1 Tax=Amniculicola lignicola CBS 123094 TaxID=1392246 RepID=A0A6A5W6G7_9PLEO|nr:hypothetical protein P154DRAFT_624479 [Amniculicola lignicola CBS 123094]